VEAGEIAEFKTQIEETVVRLMAKPPDVPSVLASGPRLLLSAQEPDQSMAAQVGESIEERAVFADVALPKHTVQAIESRYEEKLKVSHSGSMVVYEKGSSDWVLERCEEFRAIALRRKAHKPVFAIYVGTEQPLLDGRPAFVKLIDHGNDAALQQFVGDVAATGGANR